jgi:tRNA U38,U39,U40 pseudouridine synthase TruA
VTTEDIVHECKFCSTKFQSRNALFRHVKTDPLCSKEAGNETFDSSMQAVRYSIALQFSYWGAPNCTAEKSGELLQQSLQVAINDLIQSNLNSSIPSQFISDTQVSIPRLRHRSLAQESGCFAANDVKVISFLAPKGLIHSNNHVDSSKDCIRSFLNEIIIRTNSILTSRHHFVRLHAIKLLPSDSKFHAERSCTQRIYHYILPLIWLPNGSELEQWWLQHSVVDGIGPHRNRAMERPPTDSLALLKKALRSAECTSMECYTKEESQRRNVKIAAGRFGKLSTKERLPWHNFADPKLRGDASPNNEPVWRVLDRARITEMLQHTDLNGEQRVSSIIEFRGDDFLPQQIRRIVGTAIAITHSWLPSSVFDSCRVSGVLIEMPLAPSNRLYLAEAKFHFDELKSNGKSIFLSDVDGVSMIDIDPPDAIKMLRNRSLQALENDCASMSERQWLVDLKAEIVPNIRNRLKTHNSTSQLDEKSSETYSDAENPSYRRTLLMLRDIVSSGQWPETSVSRTSVICNLGSNNLAKYYEKGSFTIVNPLFFQDDGKDEALRLPLANERFPDLVDAVFELESSLISKTLLGKRATSSHCAVNCNAQFKPHVDSGRGAGQSLSMIVGLGNYVGGDLVVEGDQYDIRYKPLEFDGWKLRHWTLPFSGERFSLVWFTPAKI